VDTTYFSNDKEELGMVAKLCGVMLTSTDPATATQSAQKAAHWLKGGEGGQRKTIQTQTPATHQHGRRLSKQE
jgi:hypothetical protein